MRYPSGAERSSLSMSARIPAQAQPGLKRSEPGRLAGSELDGRNPIRRRRFRKSPPTGLCPYLRDYKARQAPRHIRHPSSEEVSQLHRARLRIAATPAADTTTPSRGLAKIPREANGAATRAATLAARVAAVSLKGVGVEHRDHAEHRGQKDAVLEGEPEQLHLFG